MSTAKSSVAKGGNQGGRKTYAPPVLVKSTLLGEIVALVKNSRDV